MDSLQKTASGQTFSATTTPPLDYLENNIASAFFTARENEAYYRSIHLIKERRGFQDQLRKVLFRLLEVVNRDGVGVLDDIIKRISRDTRNIALENPSQLVRHIEPEGMQLLGDEACIDLEHLKVAYRAAAFINHPDRGGSHQKMVAINSAYEKLHSMLLKRLPKEINYMWGPLDELASASAYLWTVRNLLFEITLDEWALDEASQWLESLRLDKLCQESNGQRMIFLVGAACILTQRLCAAGNIDQARVSLSVAHEGERLAQACGMSFGYVREAENAVAGKFKPRFILNDERQIENAFRLGAIDKKRYKENMNRLALQRGPQINSRSNRLSLLSHTKFITSLPIDVHLKPSDTINNLVPHPGYTSVRAEELTPDQQAMYLAAFRNDADLNLVEKYVFVRLSSLLRSAIFFPDINNLQSIWDEAKLLALLEPMCKKFSDDVSDIISFIKMLNVSQRAEYVEELGNLIEPCRNEFINSGVKFPIELTHNFFLAARGHALKYGVKVITPPTDSHGLRSSDLLPQPKLIWKFDIGFAVSCPPAVKYETVYIGNNLGKFYALDAMTGGKKWSFELKRCHVPTSITIVDEVVYINSNAGLRGNTIYSIDSKTGQEKWKFDGTGMYSTPAFNDGIIYVGSKKVEGKTAFIESYGLDANSGKVVWKFEKQSFIVQGLLTDTSHIIAYGLVCFVGYDGCLYGVDIKTATEKWRFDTIINAGLFPVLSQDTVYIQSKDGIVYGVNIMTGAVKWSFEIKGKFTTPLLVHGDEIYFGAGTKFLYAVNIKKNAEKWKFKAEKAIGSRPTIEDGIIYFGSYDGFIYAVDIETGEEKWKYKTKNIGCCYPFVSDGVVYFGSSDGYIYAVG